MGNTQKSYVKDAPIPMYNLSAAQQWMNAPSTSISDKLHSANSDFITSYNDFKTTFSTLMIIDSNPIINNSNIGKADTGVSIST
jgi:hypothetical protein